MAERTPLEQAEQKISAAMWLALISAGITVVFAFVSLGGEAVAGIDAWAFIDVALILGLAYGISRKSRACAVILLVYFVASKILMWVEAGNARGLPVALVFMWYFAQGVVGTFQYHNLVDGEAAAPATGTARTGTYKRDPDYRPTGGTKHDTPWLVWSILASVLLVAAGAGWYFKPSRELELAKSKPPTAQELEATVASAIGLLNRVEMNGSLSPLAAAIAVDEGLMLVPCRGITEGVPLFVKLASQDIQAKPETLEKGGEVCRLAVKDRGAYPLQRAIITPKVGDSVFAASFDANGKVVLSPGQVQKISNTTRGTVFESTARGPARVEGTPLLDGRGRVVAITIEGQDTALPQSWAANWPER